MVINIPDCDWCQDKTIYSGKWAVVEQEGATVISAITLGTQISEGIFTHAAYVPNAVKAEDYTADVTISDTLGPGQKCAYAVLFDITSTEEELKRVDCESDTFVAVNIPNFKRGQLLRLEVTADITDFDRPSCTDIGTIEAKGVAKVHYPATAAWSTVSAEGDGDTPKPGGGSNSAPPVQTPSTPVDVPVTPTTPAPQPTSSTPTAPVTPGASTTPGKPGAPSKPVTKPAAKPTYVTRTFQVDRYAPKTARATRAVAAFDDDGRLLRVALGVRDRARPGARLRRGGHEGHQRGHEEDRRCPDHRQAGLHEGRCQRGRGLGTRSWSHHHCAVGEGRNRGADLLRALVASPPSARASHGWCRGASSAVLR